jgi:hypothetical protein
MTREMRLVVAVVIAILGVLLMVKTWHHFEHYGRHCYTLNNPDGTVSAPQCSG